MIAPTEVDACSERGAAVHVAMMPPTSDLRLASAELTFTAVISPVLVCTVAGPASEVSVTSPAPPDTRTATARGTWRV